MQKQSVSWHPIDCDPHLSEIWPVSLDSKYREEYLVAPNLSADGMHVYPKNDLLAKNADTFLLWNHVALTPSSKSLFRLSARAVFMYLNV